MVTGDRCELTIQRLVAGGDGLGFLDGLAVFVPLSAPGDVLTVRISEIRRDYARAELLTVLEASTLRHTPDCPYYGECGGCNLMHLSSEAQAQARTGILREACLRAGIGPDRLPKDLAIVPSPPFGYRNRAQFHIASGGQVGYARRSSTSIIPVKDCPILVKSLRDWLGSLGQGERDSGSAYGTSPKSSVPVGRNRFLAFGTDKRIWIEGRDTEVQVDVAGKPFLFGIRGFFQSNLTVLEHLVEAVCGGMKGARAADLYAGIGLFGSFLKDRFDRVVCVEQDMQAVGYACRNVGRDADFAAADLETWTASAQAKADYDYVVVDPPRTGLAPSVRAWLSKTKPPVVGYVSCDPVSLARDAAYILNAGYHLEQLRLFDFYPQTGHVESYVRFCLD